jgi:hypothetical protein
MVRQHTPVVAAPLHNCSMRSSSRSARFVVAAETSLSMFRGFGNLAASDRRKNGHDIQQAHQIR